MRRIFSLLLLFCATGMFAQVPLKCISNTGTTTYGGVEGSGYSYSAKLVLLVLSDSVQLERAASDTSALYKQLLLHKGDTLTMQYSRWYPPSNTVDAFMYEDFPSPTTFEARGHQKLLQHYRFEKIVYTYRGKMMVLELPAREERTIAMP